jgi:competence protein ComEC
MIIGYREDLDKELLASYVNTGVVHIIAISGLHLSLIFIIIDFFVRISFGKKRTDVVGLFITIPILWGFAILTGSSASVIRSALMLTVVLISKALNKKTNGLNALMASAVILLLHNPEMLYDIGFQLSYTAVASILIFDPIIKKSIYAQNILLKKSWEMISITLSAQLLTTPLTIFYFHQFPILFLFTNLVAVPLSSIILISEILLCFVAMLNLSIIIPAEITRQLINWLNVYIQKMEHIPFGMIKHLYIGLPTLCLIYFFLIVFFRLIQHANFKNIKYLAVALLMISMVQLADIINHKKYNRIVVLNVYGKTCLLFQKGQTGVIATNMNLQENKKALIELRDQLGAVYWIKNFQFVSVPTAPSILTLDVEKITRNTQKNISKVMVITGSPHIQLKELPNQEEKELIIIADGTNKLWKIQQWETEADRLLLHFNSVAKEGPLILESQE